MTPSTVFLGKFLGLYLMAIAIAMLADRRRTLAIFEEMFASDAWMLFSGLVATAVGLAIVLCHNVWSGGALSVAVTLAGWGALLKGLALLFIPADRMASTYKSVGLARHFPLWMGFVLLLGLWMAIAAFGA